MKSLVLIGCLFLTGLTGCGISHIYSTEVILKKQSEYASCHVPLATELWIETDACVRGYQAEGFKVVQTPAPIF